MAESGEQVTEFLLNIEKKDWDDMRARIEALEKLVKTDSRLELAVENAEAITREVLASDQQARLEEAAKNYAKYEQPLRPGQYGYSAPTDFKAGAAWMKADEAKRVADILNTILTHLNNPATSQNEALCLIRRDVEEALRPWEKDNDGK